ncbi:G-patch and FHA domain containing protein [Trichuris trichiura]|uniref:G-patch and FHA domain containing protein n=1 Tax=Trichuris trichiura TaxID=36087 RepID=A0A077Z7D1_TRITR|nr:G-patch and FHA domain containing protein [Trichuris trichiura]
MADWLVEAADSGNSASIAALVTAAALEANAKNQFEFVELLGLFYDRENGYFYKENCSNFFHASTGYCYRFNPMTNQNEWTYNPNWGCDVGCAVDPAVYELLLDLCEYLDATVNKTLREPVNCEDLDLLEDEDDDLLANFYGLDKSERQLIQTETSVTPCIRIMPEQSDSLSLRSLLIVTITGATLGSDSSCGVCISDEGVSKEHCRIDYDDEQSCYMLVPMANPSYLNGIALEEGEKVELAHGDKLRIGACSLRLHIHRGFNTCAECEPGLIDLPPESTSLYSHKRGSCESRRRKELKLLKKQFGVNDFCCEKLSPGNYIDRAKIRRKVVGSDNPYEAVTEEMEVSSIEKPIPEKSKGFKMLTNLGWKTGAGLGKRQEGIKEPIKLRPNRSTSGLGSDVAAPCQTLTKEERQKRMRWDKARERYMRADRT